MRARTRYTVVSADGHAGGDIQDYRPYLASRWHDEFDAWAAEYVNPFADLLAPIAYRNWDSDTAPGRDRVGRHRGRGAVPQHRAALLQRGEPGGPAPDARGLRAPLGRRAGAQPLAGRLLRRHAGAAGRHRSGLRQRHGRRRRPRCAGPPRTSTARSAASCCRPSRPTRQLPPLWEDHYEPLWQVCADLDVPINIHGGSALPDYGEHEAARVHDADRDPVVQPPLGLAPHLLRRARAPSDAALRRDRAGGGLAAPGPRDARLVLRPHDHGRSGRGEVLRCRRGAR